MPVLLVTIRFVVPEINNFMSTLEMGVPSAENAVPEMVKAKRGDPQRVIRADILASSLNALGVPILLDAGTEQR